MFSGSQNLNLGGMGQASANAGAIGGSAAPAAAAPAAAAPGSQMPWQEMGLGFLQGAGGAEKGRFVNMGGRMYWIPGDDAGQTLMKGLQGAAAGGLGEGIRQKRAGEAGEAKDASSKRSREEKFADLDRELGLRRKGKRTAYEERPQEQKDFEKQEQEKKLLLLKLQIEKAKKDKDPIIDGSIDEVGRYLEGYK